MLYLFIDIFCVKGSLRVLCGYYSPEGRYFTATTTSLILWQGLTSSWYLQVVLTGLDLQNSIGYLWQVPKVLWYTPCLKGAYDLVRYLLSPLPCKSIPHHRAQLVDDLWIYIERYMLLYMDMNCLWYTKCIKVALIR